MCNNAVEENLICCIGGACFLSFQAVTPTSKYMQHSSPAPDPPLLMQDGSGNQAEVGVMQEEQIVEDALLSLMEMSEQSRTKVHKLALPSDFF